MGKEILFVVLFISAVVLGAALHHWTRKHGKPKR